MSENQKPEPKISDQVPYCIISCRKWCEDTDGEGGICKPAVREMAAELERVRKLVISLYRAPGLRSYMNLNGLHYIASEIAELGYEQEHSEKGGD